MSKRDSPPDGPSDGHEFHQALSELLRAARTNDIDVCGGWRIGGVDETHDFSIEILPLAPLGTEPEARAEPDVSDT